MEKGKLNFRIKILFDLMLKGRSIALNGEGLEFWNKHRFNKFNLRRVWKVHAINCNGELTICNPNTHEILEGVNPDHVKIIF